MQRAKSKKTNKKQSQRAVPRKQSKNPYVSNARTVKFQGDSTTLQYLPRHAATAQEVLQPTRLRVMNSISHPEYGMGVRVAGRQLVTGLVTTAGDSQLFAGGTATISINNFRLSPDTLNGRLALQARTYSRYCFREVTLEFVSRVPTTQAGSFVLGYSEDPAALGFGTPAFGSVCEMSPSVQASFITPHVVFPLLRNYSSQKTWFTEYAGATTPEDRQTAQGVVAGYPDVTSIGAVTMGHLWIDYVIDLYQPTLDMGFSLTKTKEESDLIVAFRERKKVPVPVLPENEIANLQMRIMQLKTGGL